MVFEIQDYPFFFNDRFFYYVIKFDSGINKNILDWCENNLNKEDYFVRETNLSVNYNSFIYIRKKEDFMAVKMKF